MKPTQQEQVEFLEKDLYDALRWLFVNAVVWHASEDRPERLPTMFASFVQARALYEFYFSPRDDNDDARVRHFLTDPNSWTEQPSSPYRKYMGPQTPAQKRVFHLVYGRSKEVNAGGAGHEGSDHLNNQVLNLAKDLRRIESSGIQAMIQADTAGGMRQHLAWSGLGFRVLVCEEDVAMARDVLNPPPDTDHVVVQTFTTQDEADSAQGALLSAGIAATIQDDSAGGWRPDVPWTGSGFRVLVRAEDLATARDVLERPDERVPKPE